jgi:hypothetical protein
MIQYSTNLDGIQIAFTTLASGPFDDWSRVMRTNFQQHATTDRNSGYYLNSGSQHGIITGDGFYDVAVDGTSLNDWLGATLKGTARPQVVDCCFGNTATTNATSAAASVRGSAIARARAAVLTAWLTADTTAATAHTNATTGATVWELPSDWYAVVKATAAGEDRVRNGSRLAEGKVMCAAAFSSRYAAADGRGVSTQVDPEHVRAALAAFKCGTDITVVAA